MNRLFIVELVTLVRGLMDVSVVKVIAQSSRITGVLD
jgi:hypothetical protein